MHEADVLQSLGVFISHIPREILRGDQSTGKLLKRIRLGINTGTIKKEVSDELLHVFFHDVHGCFEDIAGFATHWEVLMEILEGFVIEVGLTTSADLVVEFVATVGSKAITTI